MTDQEKRIESIIPFLLGEHSFEGVWFGDELPGYRTGKFWWRTKLREELASLRSEISNLDIINKKLVDLATENELKYAEESGKNIKLRSELENQSQQIASYGNEVLRLRSELAERINEKMILRQFKYINGKLYEIDDFDGFVYTNPIKITGSIFVKLKQQLLDRYCNSCEVKSSQIDDPSNEGRIYTVEI